MTSNNSICFKYSTLKKSTWYQDVFIAPMRMKKKVVAVMDQLTNATTEIEMKFNAGVVNGFSKGSFPQKVSECFFSGSIGAFSTSKRRTKIEFFWGYPLCGTSYLWFNFLRHHRSFTIIAKESQGLKMNFNRSTSVPEQCTGLRISVLPSCSQSPPCLGLGPWKL